MGDGSDQSTVGTGRSDGASFCPHCGSSRGSSAANRDLEHLVSGLVPKKMINKVTHVPLPHVYDDKLNSHMGVMNSDGWELVNIFIEAIGIEERCIMIWGKRV